MKVRPFFTWLRSLLGNHKDQELMKLFLSLTANVVESLHCLRSLLQDYADEDQRKIMSERIAILRIEGDRLAVAIKNQLGLISITTWISYELSAKLNRKLQKTLSQSLAMVKEIQAHQPDKIGGQIIALTEVIDQGGEEISALMTLFCQRNWRKNMDQIRQRIRVIDDLEVRGDALLAEALHELWPVDDNQACLTRRDLSQIIFARDSSRILEGITDSVQELGEIVHDCLAV